MTQQVWRSYSDRILACVDSYHNSVPKGRIHSHYRGTDGFESLSQFLIKLDALLDERNMPQSYTAHRTFASVMDHPGKGTLSSQLRKGTKATFDIQVIFRQHTSWQGVITWLEQDLEQSFRSVLELVMLMDSALRSEEGSGVP